jgi:hypothetical protein
VGGGSGRPRPSYWQETSFGRERVRCPDEGLGNIRDDQWDELIALVRWCSAIMLRRREFLQAAFLSLALGVGFLPVAFLDVDDRTAFGVAGVADAVLLIVLAIIARADRGD